MDAQVSSNTTCTRKKIKSLIYLFLFTEKNSSTSLQQQKW